MQGFTGGQLTGIPLDVSSIPAVTSSISLNATSIPLSVTSTPGDASSTWQFIFPEGQSRVGTPPVLNVHSHLPQPLWNGDSSTFRMAPEGDIAEGSMQVIQQCPHPSPAAQPLSTEHLQALKFLPALCLVSLHGALMSCANIISVRRDLLVLDAISASLLQSTHSLTATGATPGSKETFSSVLGTQTELNSALKTAGRGALILP